jgi:hypothetical protein
LLGEKYKASLAGKIKGFFKPLTRYVKAIIYHFQHRGLPDLKELVLYSVDDCGDVWLIRTTDNREYRLDYTVKNEVRHGVSHPANHHTIVLDGRVMWHCKICLSCPKDAGVDDKMLHPFDKLTTQKDTPHMMISFGGESVILEWLDGVKGWSEKPYPEFYDLINQKEEEVS